MRAQLLYVHSTRMGYGRYGMKLADALTRAGVDIDDRLEPSQTDPAHLVCWVATPTHAQGWFRGQHTVMSTMWETVSLPEGFREAFHNFDQLIVPSEQNVELFSRYHPNVVKVPLGVDTQEWHYRPRQTPERRFVFMIGGSGQRKGLDLAYQAFRKLWPREGSWPRESPIPTLVFKSPRAVDYAGDRIEWIGGKVSDEKERDIYAMAHCYLQPSRGEGWGLQPLQAIAQGCPTVLTDAHGQAEFAHLGYGISAGYSKADYFIHGEPGMWWEPNLDELCEQMEWVYNNYDDAATFARTASKVAHEQFSWERCAERFIEAVGREHFDLPYSGDGTWRKQALKRYLTRVIKPWRAEIAGIVYQFHPGRDYQELADVKRLLWEAGVLDSSCAFVTEPSNPDAPMVTDVESGLTEDQLARFGDYSASHGHCWECGQVLNQPGRRYEPVFED